MNTLLLTPTDILFFRDGRPMSGSLSGHGAAWPLPTVINAALHAALHRSGLESHQHVPGRSSSPRDYSGENRTNHGRKFGSLNSAGPFPVSQDGQWLFPRPLDAGNPTNDDQPELNRPNITSPTFLPLAGPFAPTDSSLPPPLNYAAANSKSPSKVLPKPWWSVEAWNDYLNEGPTALDAGHFKSDGDFSDTEFTYGIGIDATTGTQDGESFYSAHYLRLREGWRLGCLAEARDKAHGCHDIVPQLIDTDRHILTGGQQRICTAECSILPLPLPMGKADGFNLHGGKHLVKWILLTPALFPHIDDHLGGWLPSWIRQSDGQVMLKTGDTTRLPNERRAQWRKRVKNFNNIDAHLVAAITGKPIPVSGYALPNSADPGRSNGGSRTTHLAVPAGSVYYFECGGPDAAKDLAAALNWHGSGDATAIRNRRSTLMGEKGFGLGVCGTWQFYSGTRPA